MQTPIVEGIAPDLMEVVRRNEFFRRVVATGDQAQVVVMTLQPGEEIGSEVHPQTDQVFFFIEGKGDALLDEEIRSFDQGDLIFVRGGTRHNIINRGTGPLRLITIYAPPEHAPGTVHRTKQDAAHEHDEADASSLGGDGQRLIELA
jgi:mannose-6-phosphate isomerase-like protein (cupin superfamily)